MLERFSKESQNEGQDASPFKFEGAIEGIKCDIKILEKNPEKVVRIISLQERFERDWRLQTGEDDKKVGDREFFLERFKRGRKMFEELEHRYGLKAPKVDLVFGEENQGDDKAKKMYMVSDRLYGKDLDRAIDLPPEAKEKAEDLYIDLAQHFLDTYLEGGDYWWDCFNRQLFYGHKQGEEEDSFYIVDTEPYYENYSVHDQKNNEVLFEKFMHIVSGLTNTEDQFGSGIKLTRAREAIREMLGKIDKNEPAYDKIVEVKEYLTRD